MTLALLALALVAQSGWRYVVPEEGDPQRVATFATLALSPELPEDAHTEVTFRSSPSYAQLRYGTSDSVRVLLALEREAAGPARLWVDLDRNRTLEAEELVPGANETWEVALPIGFGLEPAPEPILRRVLFRMGATGTIFSCATLGYLEGRVELLGRELAVRRADGDANGFLTDARDPLWIDLDADGQWESFEELHLFAPTLKLGATRFTPRSDRLGSELALRELSGTGRIQLALTEAKLTPTALSVLLVGRDGASVGVRATGEPVEVPVGEYHVSMVSVWLADPGGGVDWSFVFSEPGGLDRARWLEVEKDALVTLDPLGKLELVAHKGGAITATAGSPVQARPALYTEDGLLINSAGRRAKSLGAADDARAGLRLLAPDGAALDAASTGFA